MELNTTRRACPACGERLWTLVHRIGQAKGMIMERYSINAGQAFEMLRKLSHDTNTPLAEVAARVVRAAAAERR